MSLALESLMRQPDAPRRAESLSGIFAFVAIGASSTLAFVVVSAMAIALLPGIESWLVSTLCYAAFIGPVYWLHRRYSFRSEALHRQALPRYIAVQAAALLLATLFGYLFHGQFGLPSLPAAVLVAGLTAGVNYLVLKSWAFAFRADLGHEQAAAVVA
jgi:putative flippase GtrA